MPRRTTWQWIVKVMSGAYLAVLGVLLIVGLAVGLVYAYSWLSGPEVTVRVANLSEGDLSDVEVRAVGEAVKVGRIAPGDDVIVSLQPKGKGDVSVVYRNAGVLRSEGLLVAGAGSSDRISFEVLGPDEDSVYVDGRW